MRHVPGPASGPELLGLGSGVQLEALLAGRSDGMKSQLELLGKECWVFCDWRSS